MCEVKPEIYRVTHVRRSRDERKCCLCGCPIKMGESYVRHSGLWDGEWDAFALHNECNEALNYASSDSDPIAFSESVEILWSDMLPARLLLPIARRLKRHGKWERFAYERKKNLWWYP